MYTAHSADVIIFGSCSEVMTKMPAATKHRSIAQANTRSFVPQ
jgi:hypothetical protein